MTRRRSTYGMPGGSGADDFRGKQLPAFEPVDDLSRFVLDRIREAETEPVADQVEPHGHPTGYRYAKHVRDDCVAFRKITNRYVIACGKSGDDWVWVAVGLRWAVKEIANRWSGHHEFQELWRLP